jgi:hypothetical protein
MRKQLLAALLASMILSGGCTTPNYLYRAIHDSYDKNYEQALMKKYKDLNSYITNYYAPKLKTGADPTEAKLVRDQILTELIWLVDADYYRRKDNLFLNRAQFHLITDVLVLGTTTAGTLAGGESIKTILSATSAGIVGAKASVHLKLRQEQCKCPSTPRPLLIFTEMRGISEHLSDGMVVVIRGDVGTIGALHNREEEI